MTNPAQPLHVQPLYVQPLAGAVGAAISGIDLQGVVSDATLAEIRRIWLQHGAVFFRYQPEPGRQCRGPPRGADNRISVSIVIGIAYCKHVQYMSH